MVTKKKIIRITTVPVSLEKLLENQLAYMQQYYAITAVSADKERLTEFGIKEGVATYAVELTRQITPIRDLIALWKLYFFLRKEKPLIVHSHTPKAGTVGMLAAKLAGVPNRLHTIAGLPLLEARGIKRTMLNFVERVTYACATKIYPNSNELKKIIIKEGFCKSNKLKVIGNGSSNGVDSAYFNKDLFNDEANNKLRNELQISAEDFVFIFVGRLVIDKGINELISAFQILSSIQANVKLLLVGPLETDLYPLAKETLIEIAENKKIISVGYQNDVRPYFAISNVAVLPSYREGFPNVVMQGGAMNLPNIVSDINGCNEIIIEGQNGLIVPVKNANALYNAMSRLYTDIELRNEIVQKSRELIVSRYEQELVWEAILAEYRQLESKLPTIIRTSTVAISLDILLRGQLAFLNQHYDVIAVSGEDEHLWNVKEREKVRTANVQMSRSISPLKDFVSLVKLYLLFRKEKPLIVHSITPKAGLLSMSAAYFAGVPVRMHTFTGLIFPYKTGFLHLLLLLTDKILCRFATNLIPEGEGVKTDLIKYKVTPKPLHVLANGNVNGVDIDYFNLNQISLSQKENLRTEIALKPTDFVFVFVGRMVADKGLKELITAFSALSTGHAACKLLLVGPFENEIDPLNEVTLRVINSNGNIILIGFQSDIRPYLAIADVFVFPSYREGFPNVLLQAGAMELPCIVSDICGSNEIIQANVNGVIVPVKNSAALLEKMQLLLNDKEFRINLQNNARELIVSKYEQTIIWQSVLTEYQRNVANV